MSRHVEIEELSALLDGELEAPRAKVVREHLAGCAACDQRRAGLERSAHTVRSLAHAMPPAEILQRVRRSASALPVERSLLDRLGGWLHPPALRPAFTSVFALVFAAVLAVFVFHSYTNRSGSSPATEKDDKLLEAYVRSGIPPGPSGRVAAEPQPAQSVDALKALSYAVAPKQKDSAAAGKPTPRSPAAAVPSPADSSDGLILRQLQKSAQAKEGAGARARVDAPAAAASAAAPAEPEMAFAPAPPPRDEEAAKDAAKKNSEERITVTGESPSLNEHAPTPSRALQLDAKARSEALADRRKQEASPRRVGSRLFDWTGGEWIERGIPARAPRRQVLASSEAGRALLRRLPGLADMTGSVIVLRDRDGVVELRPGTSP